jgi:hypothetical protein
MKRILVATLTILILTTSCQADTFHVYKDEVKELLQDPKTRKIQRNENDVSDLNGCPVLFEMGKWRLNKIGTEEFGNLRYVWGRDRSLVNGTMISDGGISIDSSAYKNSSHVTKQKNLHPIYIGPWHPITLTHTEGSFFNRKEITEQKQIRFFAYTGIGGGDIQYQYESMTEENKNIPEKKFSLSPTAKIAPDRFSLCVVKWTARFGYNAVAEVKYPGLLNKIYGVPVPTGKIIEAKE